MTEFQRLGSIIIQSKNTPFIHVSNSSGTASVESSSREVKLRPRIVLLTLGIGRSLVDSCLDCRMHEVTPPIIEKFFLQRPWCAGEHCHGERVAQPRATEVGSCAFSLDVFAPVALASSSLVGRRSSSRASATSFTLLSSVDVLGLSGIGSLSVLTQPPRKRLAQRETVLRSTIKSPQTWLKAPWIFVS